MLLPKRKPGVDDDDDPDDEAQPGVSAEDGNCTSNPQQQGHEVRGMADEFAIERDPRWLGDDVMPIRRKPGLRFLGGEPSGEVSSAA